MLPRVVAGGHRMEPYFMSQALGRYAGSRDNGQRHPHHEKNLRPTGRDNRM
jgi:hypothetical protein